MTTVVIPYKPQPRQAVYHKAKADEILYGGAAGGGKSYATIWDAFKYACKYPGSVQVIFRRTFPDLRRSIILESLKTYPKDVAWYNKAEFAWYFANGSKIELAYWDDDGNYTNYQGAQYDVIRWEELTQFKREWYVYMLSRLRGVTPYPRSVRATTNPGGLGHGWVKERFIDIGPAEQIHHMQELTDDGQPMFWPTGTPLAGQPVIRSRIFIPANVFDNQELVQNDPNYVARLMAMPDKERRQLLQGDWDVFAGQYFDEWRRDMHVIKPFAIPEHWTRIRCIDDGYANPFVCLWLAFDEEDNCYIYRELKRAKLLSSEQADLIKSLTPDHERIRYSVADTSMWVASRDSGKSPAEVYAQRGVPIIQATKERVNGWKRVREYLKVYKTRDQVTGDEKETTSLFVFDTCLAFVKDFPLLVHDDRDPEDLDTDGDDHSADALRYGLMSRPPRTKKVVEDKPLTADEIRAKRLQEANDKHFREMERGRRKR